jgi:hypothetical protein
MADMTEYFPPITLLGKHEMTVKRIKIGHQTQADEPIYLFQSGKIVCGNYQYDGKMKQQFQGIFRTICELVEHKTARDVLDVSSYRYWNAMTIYEERIAFKWRKSIGARPLEKLAIETKIFLMLEPVREEFNRAVSAKWKRIFKSSDINDPSTPTQGWHLFRKP